MCEAFHTLHLFKGKDRAHRKKIISSPAKRIAGISDIKQKSPAVLILCASYEQIVFTFLHRNIHNRVLIFLFHLGKGFLQFLSGIDLFAVHPYFGIAGDRKHCFAVPICHGPGSDVGDIPDLCLRINTIQIQLRHLGNRLQSHMLLLKIRVQAQLNPRPVCQHPFTDKPDSLFRFPEAVGISRSFLF